MLRRLWRWDASRVTSGHSSVRLEFRALNACAAGPWKSCQPWPSAHWPFQDGKEENDEVPGIPPVTSFSVSQLPSRPTQSQNIIFLSFILWRSLKYPQVFTEHLKSTCYRPGCIRSLLSYNNNPQNSKHVFSWPACPGKNWGLWGRDSTVTEVRVAISDQGVQGRLWEVLWGGLRPQDIWYKFIWQRG